MRTLAILLLALMPACDDDTSPPGYAFVTVAPHPFTSVDEADDHCADAVSAWEWETPPIPIGDYRARLNNDGFDASRIYLSACNPSEHNELDPLTLPFDLLCSASGEPLHIDAGIWTGTCVDGMANVRESDGFKTLPCSDRFKRYLLCVARD